MTAANKPIPQKQVTPADQLVGQRILALRKAKGLSQAALGTAIGISFQQLQKYEKGTNRVGAGRLSEIARLLGVSVSTFFEDTEGRADSLHNDLFALLAADGAMELLRLYASITNDELRGKVLVMVHTASKWKAP